MDRNGNPTEDELQVYSADVFRAYGVPGVVGWHTPNGARVRPAVAKQIKAFGMLPGVADWTFILPGARSAFVELKTLKKGRQSDEQKKFQHNVESLGAMYVIARTPEEIDGVFSALGVINKPVPCRGSDAMGRAEGGKVTRSPLRSTLSKVAA